MSATGEAKRLIIEMLTKGQFDDFQNKIEECINIAILEERHRHAKVLREIRQNWIMDALIWKLSYRELSATIAQCREEMDATLLKLITELEEPK